MNNTFICDECGGTFEKGWTDEEAKTERDELFPDEAEFAVVCDDCFKRIVSPLNPTEARELDL